jgi:hypothetical protein
LQARKRDAGNTLARLGRHQGRDDGRWRVVVALDAEASRHLQQAAAQPELRVVRRAVWAATDEEAADLRKIAKL